MSISNNTFHDSDYDGVVLKIPAWFIEMNNLQPELEALLQKLQGDGIKSQYYPDHVKNLFELLNRDEKKQMVGERMAKEKAIREQQELYNKDVASGKIFQLCWLNVTDAEDADYVNVGDRRFRDYKEVLTKNGVRTEFKKTFHETVNTHENLLLFIKQNRGYGSLIHYLKDTDGQIVPVDNIEVYNSNISNLGVRIRHMGVKVYEKPNRYREAYLKRRADGSMYYELMNRKVELDPSLEIRNMHLVPKDYQFKV